MVKNIDVVTIVGSPVGVPCLAIILVALKGSLWWLFRLFFYIFSVYNNFSLFTIEQPIVKQVTWPVVTVCVLSAVVYLQLSFWWCWQGKYFKRCVKKSMFMFVMRTIFAMTIMLSWWWQWILFTMITEMTNHPLCYGALINVKAALSSLFKTVFMHHIGNAHLITAKLW